MPRGSAARHRVRELEVRHAPRKRVLRCVDLLHAGLHRDDFDGEDKRSDGDALRRVDLDDAPAWILGRVFPELHGSDRAIGAAQKDGADMDRELLVDAARGELRISRDEEVARRIRRAAARSAPRGRHDLGAREEVRIRDQRKPHAGIADHGRAHRLPAARVGGVGRELRRLKHLGDDLPRERRTVGHEVMARLQREETGAIGRKQLEREHIVPDGERGAVDRLAQRRKVRDAAIGLPQALGDLGRTLVVVGQRFVAIDAEGALDQFAIAQAVRGAVLQRAHHRAGKEREECRRAREREVRREQLLPWRPRDRRAAVRCGERGTALGTSPVIRAAQVEPAFAAGLGDATMGEDGERGDRERRARDDHADFRHGERVEPAVEEERWHHRVLRSGEERAAARGDRLLVVGGEGALGARGDADDAEHAAVGGEHRHRDAAREARRARAGAHIASRVLLDVAAVDRALPFGCKARHALTDRHDLHDSEHGLGDADCGAEVQRAVGAGRVDRAAVGLEFGEDRLKRREVFGLELHCAGSVRARYSPPRVHTASG